MGRYLRRALVVLNYNDSDNTVKLANECYEFGLFDEIVIVDNDSEQNQKDLLTAGLFDGITLLTNDANLGFAKGNNVGLRYLSTKNIGSVLICCPDVTFSKEGALSAFEALEKYNVSAVSILRKELDGSEHDCFWNFEPVRKYFSRFFLVANKFRSRKKQSIKEDAPFFYVDCIRGSFICCNYDDLKDVGFFDENTFLYYEENILFSKMKENGMKVGVLTGHYYVHNHLVAKKRKTNISVLRYTYDSLYYYLVEYRRMNLFGRIIFKICSHFSIVEFKILNLFRK